MFDMLTADLEAVRSRLGRILLDSRYAMDGSTITWERYRTGIHNHVNYLHEYRWVIDERQYSFLLNDGGAVQLHYAFDTKNLVKARQCYYPSPFKMPDKIGDWPETDLSLDELLAVADDSGGSLTKPAAIRATAWSHIRFDFDGSATSHDLAHLQYSAANTFRVPSGSVLSPFVFIDMILRSFYPSEHAKYESRAWYGPTLSNSNRCCINSPLVRPNAIRIATG
jgi:hypothetical protein